MNIVKISTIVASVVTAVSGFEFIKWWSICRAYARQIEWIGRARYESR
ncbi:MAG: hypothetical protein ACLSG8_09570 [Barnesiella sp.]